MNSIVGFSLFYKLPAQKTDAALRAQAGALYYFKHLQHQSISIGESRLELWGHNNLKDRIHYLPNGSLLALIGSPLGSESLADAGDMILNTQGLEEFELPWDGRVILLLISADGKRWTMWNDWLGSIPVFRTEIADGRIISTLEPVVVAAGGFTPDDIFLPGMISLLINGHFISDWTLFKNMKFLPPDCMTEWTDRDIRSKSLWSVNPSQDRWETSWDDLVDEMHELSHRAIADVLKTQPSWILPLSSGLDSRLIAAVGAEVGADFHAYAWGGSNATDVVFSRQIAKTLGIPWKHIDIGKDFLVDYTPKWADWFGSSMHFHGMYQMCFLDKLNSEPAGPVITGFLGEDLSGDAVGDLTSVHQTPGSCQINPDGYSHWFKEEVKNLLRTPVDDALTEVSAQIAGQIKDAPGAWFQRLTFLELWNRQRLFTYFQSMLSDYWRGVATPYLNRAYARFCLSLPRAALDHRRLLGDVFRRYYGRLAVIPGTYADEPFILTGRYLLNRRVAKLLPESLHRGPFSGFEYQPLRMDMAAVQATGKDSLWPIYDAWDQLSEWLDVDHLDVAYKAVMSSMEDKRQLRKLQSVQALAYRLLDKN